MGNGRNRKKCSNRNQRKLAINNGPKVLGIKQMDNGARFRNILAAGVWGLSERKKEVNCPVWVQAKRMAQKGRSCRRFSQEKRLKVFCQLGSNHSRNALYEQTSKST